MRGRRAEPGSVGHPSRNDIPGRTIGRRGCRTLVHLGCSGSGRPALAAITRSLPLTVLLHPAAYDDQMADQPLPDLPCGMYPPVPIDDLTLVRLYRSGVGNDEVSAAIAQISADAAITVMRQRHRAHAVAESLEALDLHQRAELLELLFQEFGIPEPGSSIGIETDADRGRYFRAVVLRLLEREVEARLNRETDLDADAECTGQDEFYEDQPWPDIDEVNPENPHDWLP